MNQDQAMNQDWLRRWKCFHFHDHVLKMDGNSWGGLRCTTRECGELFSAEEYRRFAVNLEDLGEEEIGVASTKSMESGPSPRGDSVRIAPQIARP